MKRFWFALVIAGCGVLLYAQPPEFELDIENSGPPERSAFEADIEPPPPAPSPDSPVFQWMHRLRKRNPVLCKRLEKLYEDDPIAFHLRVRRLMEQERIHFVLQRYPPVLEAVNKLSAEERANFYRDIASPVLPPPPGNRPLRGGAFGSPSERPLPPIQERPFLYKWARAHTDLFKRMTDIRRRYQGASSVEEKQAIKAEAKAVLEEIHSVRRTRHMERIAHIEAELSRVKSELETNLARQSKLLEQQLSIWLEGTNTFATELEPASEGL